MKENEFTRLRQEVNFEMKYIHFKHSSLKKFLGCRDPRWKHEYLDSGQSWLMTDEEVNESDKHI